MNASLLHGEALRSGSRNAAQAVIEFARLARPPRLRTIRQFAEQEIIIPEGRWRGRRFRCDRQPYTALAFDALDSGKWRRVFAAGPTQSGKTFTFFVIPSLYYLFELQENIVSGVPTIDMVRDKWSHDLLPAIMAGERFRGYLPTKGEGSRGGLLRREVHFTHGVSDRFMTGGGGDKQRAGYTARAVIVTETDGFDVNAGGSDEADKFSQLEGRNRAYGDQRITIAECTPTTEMGRTWREIKSGTDSRIISPCPHCGRWVAPERTDLLGWQEARTDAEAAELAHFTCPACRAKFTEDERSAMLRDSRLIHRGQEIDESGAIIGEEPHVQTLGFRWNAFHNLLQPAGEVGADEWREAHNPDRENAERKMHQFVWAMPYRSSTTTEDALNEREVQGRIGSTGKGVAPSRTECVTVGIDLGAYQIHWCAIAWIPGASGQVIDYGKVFVDRGSQTLERALMASLRSFRDEFLTPGWHGAAPDLVLVDAGWQTDVVYDFTRESGSVACMPSFGRGVGQHLAGPYTRPRNAGGSVVRLGEQYHISRIRRQRGMGTVRAVEINVDHWKSWVHERFRTPVGMPGGVSFYRSASAFEHQEFSAHLTAEKVVEDLHPSRGIVRRWERIRRANHYLDTAVLASVAAAECGIRISARREGVIASGKVRQEDAAKGAEGKRRGKGSRAAKAAVMAEAGEDWFAKMRAARMRRGDGRSSSSDGRGSRWRS